MDEEKIINSEQDSEEKTPVENQKQAERKFCVKCGAELDDGQLFCPKCGQKVGEKIELSSDKRINNGEMPIKRIIMAAIAVIALVAVVFIVRGTQAKSITLSKDNLTIKVGNMETLTYTIDPEKTKNKEVTWTSSSESIAKVNNGIVSGVNEGDCIITATTKNGKTDTCEVTITSAGPDLQAIYNDYCSSLYASVASDGSYLDIDTNPDDKEEYFDSDAYEAIVAVNEALGLPESVLNKMDQTRSVDGMQSYSTDELEITWTYHPDKGIEVDYSLK